MIRKTPYSTGKEVYFATIAVLDKITSLSRYLWKIIPRILETSPINKTIEEDKNELQKRGKDWIFHIPPVRSRS